jgi:parvulin-like peptidyl-prolyl isomerase
MSYIYKVILSLSLVFFISFPLFAAEVDNTIVAKVGGVPITIYELSRGFNRLLPLAGNYHGGVDKEKVAKLQEQALDALIEQTYMVKYALDEEISVSKQQIDAVLDPVRKKYASQNAFAAAAGAEGVDGLRLSIFRRLLAKKALKVAVEDRVKVDESAIESNFAKNKHRYVRPRQFHVSHILITVRPELTAEEKAEKKKLVDGLYKKAMAGEDFYDLAYYNSEDQTRMVGGVQPPFHLGQAQPEIEAAILTMKAGDISKPIKTFYGYEIIQLREDLPETQLTFKDKREQLMQEESKKQREAFKSAWLKDLKSKYKLERISAK